MKLAFSGEARYPVFVDGFSLYSRRVRNRCSVGLSTYGKVIKLYCASLAERLYNEGVVSLPMGIGQICAVTMNRKPQYRGKKFVGYGKYMKGTYDGNMKVFGLTFLPNRNRKAALRSYGFVCNRRLFKRIKERYMSDDCPWVPIEFNDDMI